MLWASQGDFCWSERVLILETVYDDRVGRYGDSLDGRIVNVEGNPGQVLE